MKRETVALGVLAICWLIALFAMLEAKARVGYLGLPIVTVILVGYVIYLTYKGCKAAKTQNTNTENKKNEQS